MLEAMDSNIDIEIIFVKLTEEMVQVWRPVKATKISPKVYKILDDQSVPDWETWEFRPGDIVIVEEKNSDGAFLAATALAGD